MPALTIEQLRRQAITFVDRVTRGGWAMLRRVWLLVLPAIAAAAFGFPGSAAAASPWQVSVLLQHCQFTGGAHNRGYVELKVKAREIGKSGTTHFVVLSKLQDSSGLAFSDYSTWPKETSSYFPNDSTNWYHVTDRRHDFTKNEEVSFRIVITVKFENNLGETLAVRKVVGRAC
jgi:hypothetical protein